MNHILIEAFIFLAAAIVAVPLAKRLGLGSVLGYLIAGIFIGPVLGLVVAEDSQQIQHVAEFGVVMMLFLVGLELEPVKLWELRHKVFGLGGLQVLLSTAIFFVVGLMFAVEWNVALAIAMILSLSSTALVLQTLDERGLMRCSGGQSSFTVLLFQDIAVIPMLALLPLLAISGLQVDATTSSHHESLIGHYPAWARGLITLAVIAGIVFTGRFLARPIFRLIARTQLRELFTAYALFIVIGVAVLMTMIGLSPALGAFIAGMVLASSEYRHELESNIEPFKGLLLGLFFITVGAGINVALLQQEWMLVITLTLATMAIKSAVLFVLARLFKLEGVDAWLFAFALPQAGEFGFVLLSFAVGNAVIPAALADTLLLVVALSLLLTPLLFIVFDKLVAPRFLEGAESMPDTDIEGGGDVILVGHGRFGQIISRALMNCGIRPTIIDLDIVSIEGFSRFGIKTYFGDASRPEILSAAGIENAKLLIVAVDEKERALQVVHSARMSNPNIQIVARSYDRIHTYAMYQAGANQIVRETFDSSIRATRLALQSLGMEEGFAKELMKRYFEWERDGVMKMAQVYDPDLERFANQEMIDAAMRHNQETAQNIGDFFEENGLPRPTPMR